MLSTMLLLVTNAIYLQALCKVGNNCFIGSQSVLAKGITVGDDIIVGAGSLVRKSISVKGIYSGNPAILKIKAK